MRFDSSLQLVGCGRRNCSDQYCYGPGVRQVFIIHYIVKGRGFVEYGNERYQVGAGESFLIRPYEVVKYYPDAESPFEYTWLDFLQPDTSFFVDKIKTVGNGHLIAAVSPEKILPYYESLCSYDCYTVSNYTTEGLFHTILGIYADTFPIEPQGFDSDQRFRSALSLIRKNYHVTTFKVDDICRILNINRVTLYRLFKTQLNLSPSAYILQYRMEQAKKMLEFGYSVKNIAFSCGFAEPNHFTKIFKKIVGITPTQYKKGRMTNLKQEDVPE